MESESRVEVEIVKLANLRGSRKKFLPLYNPGYKLHFSIKEGLGDKKQPPLEFTPLLYLQGGTSKLNIFVIGQALPFCAKLTYLDVKLDRALTFRHHLELLCKKLKSCVGLLERLEFLIARLIFLRPIDIT